MTPLHFFSYASALHDSTPFLTVWARPFIIGLLL